mmetsp:Transcript_70045/g.227227  ORF Transcript_70045/g.227227 Transcript_70045/m.227227 type:complete len:252 (-) Transcript_70045:206-961(-)
MGAGKGHVMNWLAQHSAFPLQDMVCIDPDKFKVMMPEWSGYVQHNVKEAGSMCHAESGLLQELAQEVALRSNSHVWIDGSLGDHRWYASVFEDLRVQFPNYRIAILHVFCSPETVYARAEKRGRETGRFVPKELLKASIEETRKSIDVLGPLADFVAEVDNEWDPPWLSVLEDHSAPNIGSSEPCTEQHCHLPCLAKPSWFPCPLAQNCLVYRGPLAEFVTTVNNQLDTPWIKVRCTRSTFSFAAELAGAR